MDYLTLFGVVLVQVMAAYLCSACADTLPGAFGSPSLIARRFKAARNLLVLSELMEWVCKAVLWHEGLADLMHTNCGVINGSLFGLVASL